MRFCFENSEFNLADLLVKQVSFPRLLPQSHVFVGSLSCSAQRVWVFLSDA